MRIPLLMAAGGADWETGLLGRLEATPSEHELIVVRRCVDVIELLSVAATGQAVVAVVDAHLRRLDAEHVDRLISDGVAVVGVISTSSGARNGTDHREAGGISVSPQDSRNPEALEHDIERLLSIGVRYAVPADVTPSVLSSVVRQAHADCLGTGPARDERSYSDPGFATGPVITTGSASATGPFSASGPVGAGAAVHGPAESPNGRGDATVGVSACVTSVSRERVIAVWGPTGAPGRTTVAVAVADELARLCNEVLLVDADVYGGVIAPTLGLLDESPGVAAACRQAHSRQLTEHGLVELCWQIEPRMRVLTGLSRPDRWPEIRPVALAGMLSVARSLSDVIVVDLGFGLEDDEELSYDTVAPRRNGATLTILDEADLVLVVGTSDPIGVQRLIRGLDDLREAGVRAPIWVVANRIRRGPIPGDSAAELARALERFAGRPVAAFLPSDQASLDAAIASGRTVASVAPTGPLRVAVERLAGDLSLELDLPGKRIRAARRGNRVNRGRGRRSRRATRAGLVDSQ